MRIAIIASGGIGGYFGGVPAKAGELAHGEVHV
jgi:ketopantoate reductase